MSEKSTTIVNIEEWTALRRDLADSQKREAETRLLYREARELRDAYRLDCIKTEEERDRLTKDREDQRIALDELVKEITRTREERDRLRALMDNRWTVGKDPSGFYKKFIVCDQVNAWPTCVMADGDTEASAIDGAKQALAAKESAMTQKPPQT